MLKGSLEPHLLRGIKGSEKGPTRPTLVLGLSPPGLAMLADGSDIMEGIALWEMESDVGATKSGR